MTFKEYLDAITLDTIFCIEERFNGRLISTHLIFGFNEDDGDTAFEKDGISIETKNDYVLFGADEYGIPTFIDTAQQIEFVEKSIHVTDREDNRICLTFFKAQPIPHPVQK